MPDAGQDRKCETLNSISATGFSTQPSVDRRLASLPGQTTRAARSQRRRGRDCLLALRSQTSRPRRIAFAARKRAASELRSMPIALRASSKLSQNACLSVFRTAAPGEETRRRHPLGRRVCRRASARRARANQLRLWSASFAYVLCARSGASALRTRSSPRPHAARSGPSFSSSPGSSASARAASNSRSPRPVPTPTNGASPPPASAEASPRRRAYRGHPTAHRRPETVRLDPRKRHHRRARPQRGNYASTVTT